MGSLGTDDSDGRDTTSQANWGFDTLQVHAGLEKSPTHGQCTLPIYNTVSFKFQKSTVADEAFSAIPGYTTQVYSRFTNPTTDGFERRINALEDGIGAASFSSGTSAVMAAIMALARTGDNVIACSQIFSGTFHQFKEVLPLLGIEARFCDTNHITKVRELVDDKTKLIFTETIGNPKLSVADLEPLAALAHSWQLPLVVDATFTAAGYFCQPAKWGADVIIHSASKWIGGNGTTLGGVVIETGRSHWQANARAFPQLNGLDARPNSKTTGQEPVRHGSSLYAQAGSRAFIHFLHNTMLRQMGACLSPAAAQQLLIGTETLSLRCERQATSAAAIAAWLRAHRRVAWVRYLGFQDDPYHELAKKYLQHGFGTVLTFGLEGGATEGRGLIDSFKLIINASNVGDAKTIVGHPWSTTHRGSTAEEYEMNGVSEDMLRLSLGIEDIEDIIGDFEQAFETVGAT